jgi:hypothetical protein
MDMILSAGICIAIVACVIEISSIQLSLFKENIRIKIKQ